MAQGRVKDLESVFHQSEAELAAALSDKRALENDVVELRAQLAKVAVGGLQAPKDRLLRQTASPAACPTSSGGGWAHSGQKTAGEGDADARGPGEPLPEPAGGTGLPQGRL